MIWLWEHSWPFSRPPQVALIHHLMTMMMIIWWWSFDDDYGDDHDDDHLMIRIWEILSWFKICLLLLPVPSAEISRFVVCEMYKLAPIVIVIVISQVYISIRSHCRHSWVQLELWALVKGTNVQFLFVHLTFFHRFTHYFVEFCRDRRLRTFLKVVQKNCNIRVQSKGGQRPFEQC